jgi:hypothetical protein
MIETNRKADNRSWYVIEGFGFSNAFDLTAFDSKLDAQRYADRCDGRVVDFEGVVDKYERAALAEGSEVDRCEELAEMDIESMYIYSLEDEPSTAQKYVNAINYPCFFLAWNGHPAGATYALFDDTLPVDLEEIGGYVRDDGVFIGTNPLLSARRSLASLSNGNTITRIEIYSDQELWEREYADYCAD